jgi:hypothetical protein
MLAIQLSEASRCRFVPLRDNVSLSSALLRVSQPVGRDAHVSSPLKFQELNLNEEIW